MVSLEKRVIPKLVPSVFEATLLCQMSFRKCKSLNLF